MRKIALLIFLLIGLKASAQTFSAGLGIFSGQIVKIDATGRVVPMALTDTSGAVGVTQTGGNVGQTVNVLTSGSVQILVDGACTAGNLISISSVTAGFGHCSTSPTTQQVAIATSAIGSSGYISAIMSIGGVSGGGLPAGCTSPGTGQLTCSGNLIAGTVSSNHVTLNGADGSSKCFQADGATLCIPSLIGGIGSVAGAGAGQEGWSPNTDDLMHWYVGGVDFGTEPVYLSGIAGTDTYTSTSPVGALVKGQQYCFDPINTHTAATPTLNINSLGAKTILNPSLLVGGHIGCVVYNGSAFDTINSPLPAGAGGAGVPVGPVINAASPAFSGGIATSNADNNAQLTSAVAAVTTASAQPAIPVVHNVSTPVNCTSCQVLTPSVTITNGDTVFVFIQGATTGRTFTITDCTTNAYTAWFPRQGNGSSIQAYATNASAAVGCTGTMTITDSGAAENLGAIVVPVSGAYSFFGGNQTSSNTGTAVTSSVTTTRNNSLILYAYAWFNSATISASQNVGTLLGSITATSTVGGEAVVSNSAATPTATSGSVTLSASSPWAGLAFEVWSPPTPVPTLYIPSGTYTYTGGLSFTNPVTIKCEPGAWLDYTGVAHAADFGPTNLTSANPQTGEYTVDGCHWMGGRTMTEGLFFNPFLVNIRVRYNGFYNFGKGGSVYMIYANGNNWDTLIEHNTFITDDQQGESAMFMNNPSVNSQLRFLGNELSCWNTPFATAGCNGTPGTGVVSGGNGSQIEGNNFNFWGPSIIVPAISLGTRIVNNYFEENTAGVAVPVIQFGLSTDASNIQGLTIDGAYVNQHSNNNFLGPGSATVGLQGANISNVIELNNALATPLVHLNNVTTQTNNQSFANRCSTVTSSPIPCALIHTTGGNINQWNADNWVQITFSAATSASYTFSQTYGVAPKCGAPMAVNPSTTTFTITTLNTTTLTVTASASFTGTVQVACSAGEGQ